METKSLSILICGSDDVALQGLTQQLARPGMLVLKIVSLWLSIDIVLIATGWYLATTVRPLCLTGGDG